MHQPTTNGTSFNRESTKIYFPKVLEKIMLQRLTINWIQTIISASLIKTLLMRGCIESNPGPPNFPYKGNFYNVNVVF